MMPAHALTGVYGRHHPEIHRDHIDSMTNDSIINDEQRRAQELLGVAQPTTKPAMKEKIMSFSHGTVYMDLRLVREYDIAKQDYGEPIPKIILLVNNKFVPIPFDSVFLKQFGDFVASIGEVIEDVKLPEEKVTVEEAKEKMRKFSGVKS
jgi:hypothetical protein